MVVGSSVCRGCCVCVCGRGAASHCSRTGTSTWRRIIFRSSSYLNMERHCMCLVFVCDCRLYYLSSTSIFSRVYKTQYGSQSPYLPTISQQLLLKSNCCYYSKAAVILSEIFLLLFLLSLWPLWFEANNSTNVCVIIHSFSSLVFLGVQAGFVPSALLHDLGCHPFLFFILVSVRFALSRWPKMIGSLLIWNFQMYSSFSFLLVHFHRER